MRFFQKTGIWKIFLFNCNILTSSFLCSQNAVETFYYSVILTAFSGHLKFRYRLSLSSFCSKHLSSNRCISGLPCPIAMRFLSSESTFQALHLIIKFEAIRTSCASHLDLLMRISIWPARAHLILACTWRLEENLQLVLLKLFVDQRRQNKNSHNWSSPAPAPCAKCSHLHLGKRNNTCSCCARPGRLHWPVLNVWWTPNPNCRPNAYAN